MKQPSRRKRTLRMRYRAFLPLIDGRITTAPMWSAATHAAVVELCGRKVDALQVYGAASAILESGGRLPVGVPEGAVLWGAAARELAALHEIREPDDLPPDIMDAIGNDVHGLTDPEHWPLLFEAAAMVAADYVFRGKKDELTWWLLVREFAAWTDARVVQAGRPYAAPSSQQQMLH
jgi:hypothetical protein